MSTDGSVNRWNLYAYNAAQERRLVTPLLMPGASSAPFSARAGRRVNGSGLAVSVSGSPENWFVTPGSGVIYDAGYATQGPWQFEIPTQISGAMPARPSTGQSRIDLIVARIYDTDISVGSVREVKIERVNGTAGTSPSAPSTPALSLLLATLTVPASGTITVTPSTAVTVAAGGVLPVATTAERDALPAYKGLVVDNAQVGKLQRYDGTAWRTLSEDEDTGWLSVTPRAGFAAHTDPPQVRRRNGVVRMRGAMAPTGMTANSSFNVADLPAGLAPPSDGPGVFGPGGTSSGAATASISVSQAGVLTIRTGALSSYYYLSALAWFKD